MASQWAWKELLRLPSDVTVQTQIDVERGEEQYFDDPEDPPEALMGVLYLHEGGERRVWAEDHL